MKVRVVLVRPRYAGNVGAAVRVAANLDAAEVVLVDPECALDEDPDFRRMAMGGEGFVALSTAATLAEAVAGAQVAVATTSTRNRDPRALHTPAEARARLCAAAAGSVAVVFGPERGGLTRAELRQCHLTLAVPTNPAFPVLNLAQAVGIVLSQLDVAALDLRRPEDPMDEAATGAELRAAVEHLEGALLESGYLDAQNPARAGDQIRRWLGRTVPTRRELALLHALAAHIAYLMGPARRET